MGDINKVILGSSCPIYCVFQDVNGTRVDVGTPTVSIWDTHNTQIVTNSALTKESTGKYYYVFNASTALSTATGLYEARFTGWISGIEVKQRESRYIMVIQETATGDESYSLIQHVRRYIGDIDPSDYRYQNYEIAGFIYTAFTKLKYDYYKYAGSRITTTLTIQYDTLTFSTALDDDLTHLLILETLLLIKESEWNENSSHVGYIRTGDMIIDASKGSREQYQYLKASKDDLKDEIKRVCVAGATGARLFTYGDGTSSNTYIR